MTEDNASKNPAQNEDSTPAAPEGERRKDCRFPVRDCSLRHKKAGLLSALRSYTEEQAPLVNMSVGGLQFLTRERRTVDQKIHMLLAIPGEDEPLALKGTIVWEGRGTDTHPSRVGVVFTKASEEAWRKLRVLERAFSSKSADPKEDAP